MEAELRVTYYLNRGIQGARTDFQVKFGKETVAGVHKRPKWVPHYSVQADSGRGQDAQALLRYAHLRYAHPQLRLKQQLLTSAD
jgi:hypothetical protein